MFVYVYLSIYVSVVNSSIYIYVHIEVCIFSLNAYVSVLKRYHEVKTVLKWKSDLSFQENVIIGMLMRFHYLSVKICKFFCYSYFMFINKKHNLETKNELPLKYKNMPLNMMTS